MSEEPIKKDLKGLAVLVGYPDATAELSGDSHEYRIRFFTPEDSLKRNILSMYFEKDIPVCSYFIRIFENYTHKKYISCFETSFDAWEDYSDACHDTKNRLRVDSGDDFSLKFRLVEECDSVDKRLAKDYDDNPHRDYMSIEYSGDGLKINEAPAPLLAVKWLFDNYPEMMF